MLMFMGTLEFTWTHIKGIENKAADALSRIPSANPPVDNTLDILPHENDDLEAGIYRQPIDDEDDSKWDFLFPMATCAWDAQGGVGMDDQEFLDMLPDGECDKYSPKIRSSCTPGKPRHTKIDQDLNLHPTDIHVRFALNSRRKRKRIRIW